MKTIGIRREDKNEWERRTPLIPKHIAELKNEYSIETVVQPSKIRIFPDDDYARAGAKIQDDLSSCSIIFAVKEIPSSFFQPGKTYVFFSHTIKGQLSNMPMLKTMLDLKCQLIDYERIVDEKGKRLIAFGKYAGIAGMIDALWALGRRLTWEGVSNPFSQIARITDYESYEEARKQITGVSDRIREDGIPESLIPLVFGITGYGNVSHGAQEILDLLSVREISPKDIGSLFTRQKSPGSQIYKVVFEEENIVEPKDDTAGFELQDYYKHPEKYRSCFHSYVPYLTLLVNGIYWDKRYPTLLTKEYLRKAHQEGNTRLRVICDISCDIEGSMECTIQSTDPANPVFVYDPVDDRAISGWKGPGPVVLAVDNLPCELPRESSAYFSRILRKYVPQLVKADFSTDFSQCGLSVPIKNGLIVYHGELTPEYQYIQKHLE